MMDKPECYGKRMEAGDKCEKCKFLVECSKKTLKDRFGERVDIIGP